MLAAFLKLQIVKLFFYNAYSFSVFLAFLQSLPQVFFSSFLHLAQSFLPSQANTAPVVSKAATANIIIFFIKSGLED